MSEMLRPFDEILQPDPRLAAFVIRESPDEDFRPLQLEDLHKWVASITLSANVPQDVRDEFVTAQYLLVYSFLHYPLDTVAGFWATKCLEHGLAIRLNDNDSNLRDLIDKARKQGLLSPVDCDRCDALRHLRNSSAHAGRMIHGQSLSFLDGVADFLNRLFP